MKETYRHLSSCRGGSGFGHGGDAGVVVILECNVMVEGSLSSKSSLGPDQIFKPCIQGLKFSLSTNNHVITYLSNLYVDV